MTTTHEDYIQAVAAIGLARLPKKTQAAFKREVKLVYGRGQRGLRGITCHHDWERSARGKAKTKVCTLIEICAYGQQDWTQLAGTTLHEIGHWLAGVGHGHDKAWREACAELGLSTAVVGMTYEPACFDSHAWALIKKLKTPTDGKPASAGLLPLGRKSGGCAAGVGVRGGKSRGTGSGSRLRKWVCACKPKPVIVRAATDELDVTCNVCDTAFVLAPAKGG